MGKRDMSNTAKKLAEKAESKSNLNVVKTEEKASVPIQQNHVLSVEKRIQKVETLSILVQKWRKLNESKNELNKFRLNDDGINSTMTIKNSNGEEFRTSHSEAVEAVIDSISKMVDEKLNEVEASIDFN